MGSVFRKATTRPLPAGAELFKRKGEPMARWRGRNGKLQTARVSTGKDGKQRLLTESATYYARYRDHAGLIVERPTGCRDRQAAEQLLAGWERDQERIRANVLTPAEQRTSGHLARPLAEHVDAYLAHLEATGACSTHRGDCRRYLDRLARESGLTRLGDISRDRLETWLAARSREGMGARTRNAHRNTLVAFCNWCLDTERLTVNPVERVKRANEKADPRRKRRAMTEDELRRLLDAARRRPLEERLTIRRGRKAGQPLASLTPATRAALERRGRERALVYKMLVLTGLRRGELASLTVAKLRLDDDAPCVELEAADEKNREGSSIPLRADLAADLRDWLADELQRLQADARTKGLPVPLRLPPDTPLFHVPEKLVKVLDRDLRLAGIPKRDDRGRTLDVHALRHTFGTLLSKGGVTPQVAQQAMRHSTIDLTMNVYTDPRLLDIAGAVEALPDLPLTGPTRQAATGTAGAVTPPKRACLVALPVAAPPCNAEKTLTTADNGTPVAIETALAASGCPDNAKACADNPGPSGRCWDRTSDPLLVRQEGSCSQEIAEQQVTTSAPLRCTPGCCESPPPLSVEQLADAIRRLSPDDRTRLVALLLGPAG